MWILRRMIVVIGNSRRMIVVIGNSFLLLFLNWPQRVIVTRMRGLPVGYGLVAQWNER
jgi:hypothetical protein